MFCRLRPSSQGRSPIRLEMTEIADIGVVIRIVEIVPKGSRIYLLIITKFFTVQRFQNP